MCQLCQLNERAQKDNTKIILIAVCGLGDSPVVYQRHVTELEWQNCGPKLLEHIFWHAAKVYNSLFDDAKRITKNIFSKIALDRREKSKGDPLNSPDGV